jgi:cation-transporting P-type ATPase I
VAFDLVRKTVAAAAVLLSALGSAAVLALIVQTPGVSTFFGCVPLDPFAWATALGAIAAAVAAGRLLPGTIDRATSTERS